MHFPLLISLEKKINCCSVLCFLLLQKHGLVVCFINIFFISLHCETALLYMIAREWDSSLPHKHFQKQQSNCYFYRSSVTISQVNFPPHPLYIYYHKFKIGRYVNANKNNTFVKSTFVHPSFFIYPFFNFCSACINYFCCSPITEINFITFLYY